MGGKNSHGKNITLSRDEEFGLTTAAAFHCAGQADVSAIPQHNGSNNGSGNERTVSMASNEYVLNVAFGSFFGFTVLQFIFALAAHSQAMMADCAAMAVDAITYLFNYSAEYIKHRPLTEQEQELDPHVLHQQKKLQRLYLELIPPLLSVSTLVVVTVVSLKQAIDVLLEDEPLEYPPDVVIMLLFSGMNLILDVFNVTCFARAEEKVVGIPSSFLEHHHDRENDSKGQAKAATNSLERTAGNTELTRLLSQTSEDDNDSTAYTAPADASTLDDNETSSTASSQNHLNLNMCSAWTHVCADTLRSITTLLAAGFSWLFPQVLSPADADSCGAIFISIIIIVSLGPLIQGLYTTALEVRECTVAMTEQDGGHRRVGYHSPRNRR